MTNPFERLVLSTMTSPKAGFKDGVLAVAEAGFSDIGFRPGDRTRAHVDGLSDADLRGLLTDHDIDVIEIDVLVGWGMGEDEVAKAERHEARIYELADELGAQRVTLTGHLSGPWECSVELFAGVCDRAARHDLALAIEFLPWSDVPDADTARRLFESAGRPNGACSSIPGITSAVPRRTSNFSLFHPTSFWACSSTTAS